MEYLTKNKNATNYNLVIDKLSSYIDNPVSLESGNLDIYSGKCSGCRSCGGGCYGCKVTSDMLEAKLED